MAAVLPLSVSAESPFDSEPEPPTITGVSPKSGPAAGGTKLTISGTNFVVNSTNATVGGLPLLSPKVISPTSMTGTTSRSAFVGVVDVSVNTPGGQATGKGLYTFLGAPVVSGIAPNSGPVDGGTSVTISGLFFTGVTAVTFGGAPATNVHLINSSVIQATTPAHAAGVVDVAVATRGGTGKGIGLYTYGELTVTKVNPKSGSPRGGTKVTITGTNFGLATAVTFGGKPATDVTVISDTSITATTPQSTAGPVDVAVTTPSGTATGAKLYTFFAMIDVLVAYTKNAKADSPNILSDIKLGISLTNSVYKRSGVYSELRSVGSIEVDYDEAKYGGDEDAYKAVLCDLAGVRIGCGNNQTAAFKAVRTLRNKRKADLVVLIRRSGALCGAAFTTVTDEYGFAVVSRGNNNSCIVGNGFAHEIGHLRGLYHDRFWEGVHGVGFKPASEYNFGYVDTVGKFRDIMSYPDECASKGLVCKPVDFFSTPLKEYNKRKLGIEQNRPRAADGVRLLNETSWITEGYR